MTPQSIKRFADNRIALQAVCYGQPITFRGQTRTLTLSDVSTRRDLEDGGFRLIHEATLRIPIVPGMTKPANGETITRASDGRQYRINEVVDDPVGAEWVCGLEGL